MKLSRSLLVLGLVAAVTAACSGDDGTESGDASTRPSTTSMSSTSVSTSAATTTVAPSTLASTTVPSTTVGPTTSAGPTTTEVCDAITNLDPVEVDWPQKLSSLYGDDVDTGAHPCFERVVINFAGTGDLPGYSIRYQDDPLVLASSGEPTALRGEANLIITVGSWMGDLEAGGYTGPMQMFPDNVSNIEEVTLIDNFESVMIWGVGLDRQRPFTVFTLSDPDRLVVDIANG